MKALIYKDLLAVWKYCRNFIIMCAVFLLASVFMEEYSFLQMYPVIFMGMLVNTLIAYDERDHWDRQVLTMPVSRKQYVTAKYLVAVIMQTVVLTLTIAAHAIQLLRTGSFNWESLGMTAVILLTLATLTPSLILPFVFKEGSEKGRMAYLIVVAGACALGAAGTAVLNKLGMMDKSVEIPFAPLMAVLVVLLIPVSWALSVKWYERREL